MMTIGYLNKMEEKNEVVDKLLELEELAIEAMRPKGLIPENLTLILFNQLDQARKNLIQNG
jgi:hypothetical protein